ncbi:MAG: AAA family ATPase [Oscillatoriales cyanobacterium SM2_3_0]|nr:AAA family ATPase [Oscillatoriales cyanobacterium SM2_3_0]
MPLETTIPLADRMRPQTLEEFVGQDHILAPGRLLWRAIQADQLASLIFYGPPGTGKTTLARIIANTTQAHFIALNAVLSGVKDIRGAIASATRMQQLSQRRTILFIDEVHRFNKSQQDALLPWVENGTVILIGATTENPYFEVNKALVSRSRLFQLRPLTETDLDRIARQALANPDRGYGGRRIEVEPEALMHLVNVANGDARTLLNALELAVETTPPDSQDMIVLTLAVAEESIQQRAVLYDKEGDAHFDTISAFIKSVRGSDPDAALYWLARMVYAGEDPRFILRRLLILASEDIGLADPQAIAIVNACAQAFDRVGMPEGRYPLAHATLYLATAPKSNSVMGFFDALAAVDQERQGEVPNPLKDGNRDKKGLGHGAGYLYPHAYRDHWVAQQYLPQSLQGRVFYQPSNQGFEGQIQDQVARRREAQLAAGLETVTPGEHLTSTPDRAVDRWLQRSLSQTGDQLAQLRDRLFDLAQLQHHSSILDLNAGSGLLTWEALRRAPEGGVYACAWTPLEAEALRGQIAPLPVLNRPVVLETFGSDTQGLETSWKNLDETLAQIAPEIKFDCIIGRNVLVQDPDKLNSVKTWRKFLISSGKIVLAESIPRHTQRLYKLLNSEALNPDLYQQLIDGEEAIYQTPDDPLVNWDGEALNAIFAQAGFAVQGHIIQASTPRLISQGLLDRWFPPLGNSGLSYSARLAKKLMAVDIARIRNIFYQNLLNQTVLWHGRPYC